MTMMMQPVKTLAIRFPNPPTIPGLRVKPGFLNDFTAACAHAAFAAQGLCPSPEDFLHVSRIVGPKGRVLMSERALDLRAYFRATFMADESLWWDKPPNHFKPRATARAHD